MWLENHAGRHWQDFDACWEKTGRGVRRLSVVSRRAEIEAISRTVGNARYFAAALTLVNRGREVLTRTIVSVFGVPGAARLRITLLAPGRTGWRQPHTPWSPALIGRLARRPGLTDYGFPLRAEPWVISTSSDVDEFVHLITHPGRTRPIFATGLASGETDPQTAVLDPEELQQRTVGLSHVVVVTGPMTFLLSKRIGKRFSVFGNAFRTYRPGCDLDPEKDAHPMALGETMAAWAPRNARRFFDSLQCEVLRTSVALQAHPGHRLPSRQDAPSLAIRPAHRQWTTFGRDEDTGSQAAEHRSGLLSQRR